MKKALITAVAIDFVWKSSEVIIGVKQFFTVDDAEKMNKD
jgi:hypothetical protein